MRKGSFNLASPLGLISQLRPDRLRFTAAAWIGVALIGLGFSLLGGRFIFAPGITIDLPMVTSTAEPGLPTAKVLTIGQNGTFFFEGRVLTPATLATALKKARPEGQGLATLLIKGDKATPLQTFLQVCQWARESGFDHIQVATLPLPQAPVLFK